MSRIQKFLLVVCLLFVSNLSSGAQVLLMDDFEDGDASSWVAFEPGWLEADGVFHATNTRANVPVEVVYEPGLDWADYSAEVDITPLSQHFPVGTSLYFRWNEKTLDPDQSFAACDLLVGTLGGTVGTWLRLFTRLGPNGEADFVPFSWQAAGTYRLRATAVGSTLTCEVVGFPQTLIELESQLIQSQGTVALRSTHIKSDFDNLLVEEISVCEFGPPEAPLLVERGTGAPRVVPFEWESCGGPGVMRIRSLGVASAFVWLNDELLLVPSDFSGKNAAIEIPVHLLEGENALDVELRGKPGSQMEIDFSVE